MGRRRDAPAAAHDRAARRRAPAGVDRRRAAGGRRARGTRCWRPSAPSSAWSPRRCRWPAPRGCWSRCSAARSRTPSRNGRARSPAATRSTCPSWAAPATAVSDVLAGGRPPPQLVRLIRDRLERLSPGAAALARAVAVLGADAEPRRARALAGLDATAARGAEEELGGERVIERTRSRIRSSPQRYARASTRRWPPICMRTRPCCSPTKASTTCASPSTCVSRCRAATTTVVATLRRAAEAARRVGGLATAARLLERALDEPPPPELVDAIDFERGRVLLDAGEERRGDVLAAPRPPWGGAARPRARRAAPRAAPGAGRPQRGSGGPARHRTGRARRLAS